MISDVFTTYCVSLILKLEPFVTFFGGTFVGMYFSDDRMYDEASITI